MAKTYDHIYRYGPAPAHSRMRAFEGAGRTGAPRTAPARHASGPGMAALPIDRPGARAGSAAMNAGSVVAILLVVALVALLSQAIRVVREYQRLVVFRLGKVIGAKGP